MQGTVKFFDAVKGWGFITGADGKEIFVHQSNIIMDGFRSLDEGDIVSFEIGEGKDGKEQAVNVTPILTTEMVTHELSKENLHLMRDDCKGKHGWRVVDALENLVVDKEMDLIELAAFAGIDTSGLEENGGQEMMNKEQTINKILEEYRKYGIQKGLAEMVYDLAIQVDVPQEMIYPGMKLIFNNALGIDNKDVIEEVGEGFTQFSVNDTRKANPTATDKIIAKNKEEELAEGFDWKSFELPEEIADAIKNATEKFIESNK